MATLANKLEAILFYSGEAETKERLASLLQVSLEELEEAAHDLSDTLATRGVRLLSIDSQLELVTAPETSDVVTKVRKEELVRDLGKAGAETLAVILYRGPVSRADIEYIRGVNCSFIVRNLLIRGLIERVQGEKGRSILYRVTPDMLKHLGLTSLQALPGYEAVRSELQGFVEKKGGGVSDSTG